MTPEERLEEYTRAVQASGAMVPSVKYNLIENMRIKLGLGLKSRSKNVDAPVSSQPPRLGVDMSEFERKFKEVENRANVLLSTGSEFVTYVTGNLQTYSVYNSRRRSLEPDQEITAEELRLMAKRQGFKIVPERTTDDAIVDADRGDSGESCGMSVYRAKRKVIIDP